MDVSDERISRIESRLERMEAMLERLEHDLLGNGQPGAISLLSKRLTVLEAFRWQVLGAGILISAAFAVIQLIASTKGK